MEEALDDIVADEALDSEDVQQDPEGEASDHADEDPDGEAAPSVPIALQGSPLRVLAAGPRPEHYNEGPVCAGSASCDARARPDRPRASPTPTAQPTM